MVGKSSNLLEEVANNKREEIDGEEDAVSDRRRGYVKPRGHSHVRENELCYPKNSSFLGQNIILSANLSILFWS